MADPTGSQTDPFLTVAGITKAFGRFTALHAVAFQARRGEFLCVLGPSGCGKTTLLRVIAGLERPDGGRVFFAGRDVSDLPVSQRNVGIVFQSYALFPNLTAEQNIAYGLKSQRVGWNAIRRRVEELLRLVGLEGLEGKYPRQLSGGQQQRVALARAMALSPDLLLLDEPLSALDAQVRFLLRAEVRELQRRLGVTTLMVTHDQEEALTMADRILVMDRGEVVQDGAPMEIYRKPATPFVAAFIGSMNFLSGGITESPGRYRIGSVSLTAQNGITHISPGTPVTMAIRPEDVAIERSREAGDNTVVGKVRSLEFRGPLYRLSVHLPVGAGRILPVQADVSTQTLQRLAIHEGMDLPIHLPADRIRVYPN